MTMDGTIKGKPIAEYLWKDRGVVPILKIDKGLADEADGVKLMKPMPELDELLDRRRQRIFGTKERSVIEAGHRRPASPPSSNSSSTSGRQVLDQGLVPILEPEVNIKSPEKAGCEDILKAEILKHLGQAFRRRKVMLKLTLPDQDGFLCGAHRPRRRCCASSPCRAATAATRPTPS